ncbi:hypothetical protein GCM10010517_22630 [Streptosporangium fragile]|uniref:Uncharacterized protein n=1 Tax=Streptosporangium fragile TaxID=46186 RepID=A0ABP6IAS7_9ACTN
MVFLPRGRSGGGSAPLSAAAGTPEANTGRAAVAGGPRLDDPRALSSFWRDVLGYVRPGPPGVDLSEDADPPAAWDDFLARVGVPEEQRVLPCRIALRDKNCALTGNKRRL